MQYGIKIETFAIAGRYQHKVYDIGVKPEGIGKLSEDVVKAQKRVNEKSWEEMPEGATGLVAIIKYKAPKK